MCILHLGLRITEKLLRLEADAKYTQQKLSAIQRKQHCEMLNAALNQLVSGIRVYPPGHQKSQDSKMSERSEVVGLKGDHLGVLAKSPQVFVKQFVGRTTTTTAKHYEAAIELWTCWRDILEMLGKHHKDSAIAKAEMSVLVTEFATLYSTLYHHCEVTPYIHILVCHVPDLLGIFGDLSMRSQQGLERTHGDQKLTMRTVVSQGPGLSRNPNLSNMQLLERDYRTRLMEKDSTRFDPEMLKHINEDEDLESSSNAVDEDQWEDSDD